MSPFFSAGVLHERQGRIPRPVEMTLVPPEQVFQGVFLPLLVEEAKTGCVVSRALAGVWPTCASSGVVYVHHGTTRSRARPPRRC